MLTVQGRRSCPYFHTSRAKQLSRAPGSGSSHRSLPRWPGRAERNDPEESDRSRVRWRSSQQLSLSGSSALAAPRFSPVEQRRARVSKAEEKGQGIACTNSP